MRELFHSAWALIVGWLLLSFWLVAVAAGPIRRLGDATWLFILGWVLLIALAAALSKSLPHDYRRRLRPGFWTLVVVKTFSGVHLALAVVAAVRSTWRFSLPVPLALAVGALLVAAGTVICLAAVYAYGGSVMRLSGLKTDRLVTNGIYRWSRNPQMVGGTVILAGVGLICRSGMVLLLTVFFWLAVRLYLPVEEELLARLYGDAYLHYRRSTGRYFGRHKAGAAAA